ncbi:MAG: transcription-repair coupling factor [Bacilli bacterium]|nr:transcription-repair coupling factor [Bacilli bacterium]
MNFFDDKINNKLENETAIFCSNDEFSCIYINSLRKNNILVVTNTLYEANKIFNSLINYNNNVLFFPTDDFLSEEFLASSPELEMTRLETINEIVFSKEKHIVVTDFMGLIRLLPKKKSWKKNCINIKTGQIIEKEILINNLDSIGYEMTPLINKTGDIANRGFILDIFPSLSDKPVRIEFWDNTIESIRYFELETQLSINNIEEIVIYPVSEFISNTENSIKKQKYLAKYEEVSSILDYLENEIVIFKDYNLIEKSYVRLQEQIIEHIKSNDNEPNTNYFHSLYDFKAKNIIYLNTLDNISSIKHKVYLDTKEITNYNENFELLRKDLNFYIKEHKTVIIAFDSKKKIDNFKELININVINTNESKIFANSINVIEKKLNQGFIFENYIFISESNIYKQLDNKRQYNSKFRFGTKIKDMSKLNIGDYVVHEAHGIGIYSGIIALNKNGAIKDYLLIKYKNNENLYIPVEKIDLITKYSLNEGLKPKINSLGGSDWVNTKYKVKNRIKDIAEKLIKLSAERKATEGFAFNKDDEEQINFEKEFIYEETKDQLISTMQIKKDMESNSPMDRILCGDVGYGKTEVAFRAMFKAVNSGKQVAYLCPTTLLSNQQYNNAISRFKSYPFSIVILNRFTSKKEVNRIIEGLKKGSIDMVFGTHRLLSKDIEFKSLGLLIIDEEQRFGVTHKEKIKEYKTNIDVLTLSATPIPRTMQMALIGLRDLSLIETPPVNRYPIQTYVLEENNQIIKEAIYKELVRKGQIYILFNNIEKIERKVQEIQSLVSEARIVYAHGKMKKNDIENIMIDFIDQKYDVLICTTIIETGIDIPNVNTLIIIDADRFGLSQLYQIRGRVGRTNKIAYAYLMYDKRKNLGETATKRLKTIKEFTELGSGLSIAIRDLSIRGSGDILGSEQSGFIDSVGIELYTKMVNEEVEKIKGNYQKETESLDTSLINIDTHIDDSYVKDESLKIEIHKRINEIDSYEKLLEVKKEIEDRFGRINEKLLLYMYQEWFEKLANEKGVEKINQNKNSIDIYISKEKTDSIEINDFYQRTLSIGKMFKFSYEYKRLKITIELIKLEKHWLYYALELIILIDKYTINDIIY